MTDALIVGGGPAGSVTALLLARRGWEVELVDRAPFPRPKPCGDCLSAGGTALLERLGLLSRVEALAPAQLRGWRITGASGGFAARFPAATTSPRDADSAAAGSAFAATALSVRRERLDAALLDAAREAGVGVSTGVHVSELLREQRRVVGVSGRGAVDGSPLRRRARIVVGADGLRSVVARRLGLVRGAARLRKLSLTAHLQGVLGVGEVGEMYIGEGWCIGVAPVGRGVVNVTLVTRADRYAASVRAGARDFFWERIDDVPGLGKRTADAFCAASGERRGGPVRLLASGPFEVRTRAVAADGAVLVGDAAGYYDPFTGQGIHHAIACAELLAEELDLALRRRNVELGALRRYARRRARLLGGPRALQRVVELVIARPQVFGLVSRRLAAAPAAAETLIAATGDLVRPRALLSPRNAVSFLLAAASPEDPT